jgi:hypothetical protein
MKLKFEKEIQSVIDRVSELPETITKENITAIPDLLSFASGLDRDLLRQRDAKTIPVKYWVKLRRQLSFLYELGLMADKATKNHLPSDKETERLIKYTFLLNAVKDIKSGKALQRPEFIRIALIYGVLHLSDHEIAGLITNNKI